MLSFMKVDLAFHLLQEAGGDISSSCKKAEVASAARSGRSMRYSRFTNLYCMILSYNVALSYLSLLYYTVICSLVRRRNMVPFATVVPISSKKARWHPHLVPETGGVTAFLQEGGCVITISLDYKIIISPNIVMYYIVFSLFYCIVLGYLLLG